jgi:hypothetical protein
MCHRWSYLKAQCLERQSQDIFVRVPPAATHVQLVDHKVGSSRPVKKEV